MRRKEGQALAGEGGPGNTVDVVSASGFPRGSMGVGTVHHVAFRVSDDETQVALREEISALGYNVTPVLDRNYFRSILSGARRRPFRDRHRPTRLCR